MALTDSEEQALLVEAVGDTATGALATNVGKFWDRYATSASPELRRLYTRRDLIVLAMGELRKEASYDGHQDIAVELKDRMDNLLAMKRDVDGDIALAKQDVAGGGVTQDGLGYAYAGELIVESSTSMVRPLGAARADSLRYRGSPYRPNKRYPDR